MSFSLLNFFYTSLFPSSYFPTPHTYLYTYSTAALTPYIPVKSSQLTNSTSKCTPTSSPSSFPNLHKIAIFQSRDHRSL